LTITVAAAAVAVAAASLHREFVATDRRVRTATATDPPTYEPNWRELVQAGVVIGSASAPVTVVEFSDLECPVCARFHTTVRDALKRFGDSVSFVFVHYPLAQHRFARNAARGAECAGQQGRFYEFVDAVYGRQDSLGLKPWPAFARQAGVRDLRAFSECMRDTQPRPRIERGLSAGERFQVKGTPTVIVNGWRFPVPPFGVLEERIAEILQDSAQRPRAVRPATVRDRAAGGQTRWHDPPVEPVPGTPSSASSLALREKR
jgi:protein-disulfide isomerase